MKDEDVPRDPTACRKRLSQILARSGCKHVPFHALRHTFASHAFHYGMDVKTLASTIGHESVETTLNVYAHISDKIKEEAAKQIDNTIGTATGENLFCVAMKKAVNNCAKKKHSKPHGRYLSRTSRNTAAAAQAHFIRSARTHGKADTPPP